MHTIYNSTTLKCRNPYLNFDRLKGLDFLPGNLRVSERGP